MQYFARGRFCHARCNPRARRPTDPKMNQEFPGGDRSKVWVSRLPEWAGRVGRIEQQASAVLCWRLLPPRIAVQLGGSLNRKSQTTSLKPLREVGMRSAATAGTE